MTVRLSCLGDGDGLVTVTCGHVSLRIKLLYFLFIFGSYVGLIQGSTFLPLLKTLPLPLFRFQENECIKLQCTVQVCMSLCVTCLEIATDAAEAFEDEERTALDEPEL